MVITEFAAINFRNYRELFVTFSDRINLIVGGNGQGKTNLVEGLYFLGHLDSFRTHRLEQLPHFGEPACYVQGTIEREDRPAHKARVELSRQGRRVWLDEEPVRRLSTYATAFYVLVFNPDSLYAYRNVPAERRALYDRLASFVDWDYLDAMREFKSILAQKNRLLKSEDYSSLPDWNQLFIERSCVIINKRRELVERINALLPSMFRRLAGRAEALTLAYLPTMRGEREADESLLKRVETKEARAGHALYGPHRDDFQLAMTEGDGQRGEAFFSQGEYRLALLTLKLALNELLEQHLGHRPVIILDDLYSELDAGIRMQLTEELMRVRNQIFVTSTESPEAIGLPEARVMEIREGHIA